MKLPYLFKRHNRYWYRRKVNEEQCFRLNLPPTQREFQLNLKTSDEAEALRLRAKLNKMLDLESGTAKLEMYEGALRIVKETQEYPHHVADALSMTPEDEREEVFNSFPAHDRAHYQAAQEVLRGRSRPIEYTATMRQLHAQWKEVKLRTNKEQTVYRAESALNNLLGHDKDKPMILITQDSVQTIVNDWIDTGSKKYKTIKNNLQVLGDIIEFAKKRKLIDPSIDNPFRDIDKGKNNSKKTAMMSDAMLRDVLSHLRPAKHYPSIIARATGMRQSEIFNSRIITEEGIVCFTVEDAKTEAGIRLVPIRDDLIEYAHEYHHTLTVAKSYSNLFGAAKKKVTDRADIKFHSLRSTFITLALRAKYTEMQVAWLAGHEHGKGEALTGSHYHQGYTVEFLKEIVEAVPKFEL